MNFIGKIYDNMNYLRDRDKWKYLLFVSIIK